MSSLAKVVIVDTAGNPVVLSGSIVIQSNDGTVAISSGRITVASGLSLVGSGISVFISGLGTSSNISGQNVVVSSGAISVVSGSVTVNSGAIQLMSGAFNVAVTSGAISIQSGAISIVSGSVTVNSGTITVGSGLGAVMSGVAVSTSGNPTSVSSGAISVVSGSITINSGQVAVSGFYQGGAALESGIGGVSGIIPVGLTGFDLSGAKWNPVSTYASGLNFLNVFVQSGGVSVGSGVYLASGLSIISGQSVTIQSGVFLASGLSIISGQSVSVASGLFLASGNPPSLAILSGAISIISGSITINSGQIAVSGFYQGGLAFESGIGGISGAIPVVMMGFDLSGAKWNPVSIYTSGLNFLNVFVQSGGVSIGSGAFLASGLSVVVGSGLFLASGNPPSLAILSGSITIGSGAAAVMSGVPVASGLWLASGIIPNISGQAISVSGNVVYQAGRHLNTGGAVIVTGNSGGQALATSQACYAVNIRSASGNNPIWVGGSGNYPVAISGQVSGGVGIQIYPVDGVVPFRINTPALVFVAAELSGNKLTWLAESP